MSQKRLSMQTSAGSQYPLCNRQLLCLLWASHISHLSFWHDSNACKIFIILRSIWINIISQQFNNYYSLFFVNTFHFLVMLYWLINNNLHFFIVPLRLYFLMGGIRKSTNSVLSLRECKWFHSNLWLKAVLVIA